MKSTSLGRFSLVKDDEIMKLAKNRDSIRPSEGVSHMKWNFLEGISLPLVGQGMPRGDRVVLAPILCARKCTRGAQIYIYREAQGNM